MTLEATDTDLQTHFEPLAPAGRKKPGPKPGSRHAGMFQPGEDPRRNKGGKVSEARKNLQSLAQEQTQAAVETLTAIMGNADEPTKERRAAAETLLAHGHGTPVSRVLMADMGNNPAGANLADASPEQLMAWVAGIREEQQLPSPTYEGEIYEGEGYVLTPENTGD